MITNAKIIASATLIGCAPEAIMAVDLTESGGNGFLPSGKPALLFEPHIFWKQLLQMQIDPKPFSLQAQYADILYPVWGTKPYGRYSAQEGRMELAFKINKPAALMSASWGRYQVMGFNWKLCGVSSLQMFVDKMNKSEDDHLEMFVNYIKAEHLDVDLIHEDWDGFALGYNGPLWRKNDYGNKLKANFNKAKLLLSK